VRVGIVIVAIGALLLAYAAFRIVSFGSSSEQPRGARVPELESSEFCSRYEPTTLPPGFELLRRDTRNLGDSTIGRSYVYGDGTRTIEFHVGYKALDQYEDLDFVEREVNDSGVRRTVHVPRALGGDFLGVTWTDEEEAGPCSSLTAIGRRVDEATLLQSVVGLRRVGR
jgi:hypothetical protein